MGDERCGFSYGTAAICVDFGPTQKIAYMLAYTAPVAEIKAVDVDLEKR